MRGDDKRKDECKVDIENRLRRVEGQIRHLQCMIDDDRAAVEVLDQVAVVINALRSVAARLLDDHVATCLAEAAGHDDPLAAQRNVTEVTEAIARLMR